MAVVAALASQPTARRFRLQLTSGRAAVRPRGNFTVSERTNEQEQPRSGAENNRQAEADVLKQWQIVLRCPGCVNNNNCVALDTLCGGGGGELSGGK